MAEYRVELQSLGQILVKKPYSFDPQNMTVNLDSISGPLQNGQNYKLIIKPEKVKYDYEIQPFDQDTPFSQGAELDFTYES